MVRKAKGDHLLVRRFAFRIIIRGNGRDFKWEISNMSVDI